LRLTTCIKRTWWWQWATFNPLTSDISLALAKVQTFQSHFLTFENNSRTYVCVGPFQGQPWIQGRHGKPAFVISTIKMLMIKIMIAIGYC